MPGDKILLPRGNYSDLLSFQKAEIIYDITFRFAHKYLGKSDRTIDQMIQSARSGEKNLLEGSKASLTSTETEIKLHQRRPLPHPPGKLSVGPATPPPRKRFPRPRRSSNA